MKRNNIEKGTIKKAVLAFGLVLALTGCGKADSAYQDAMDLANAGKYEKALPYFEKAIKANDEQMDYYIGYGMSLNHLGRFKEAKKTLTKVVQDTDNKISKENNKQLYYGIAVAEYGLGNYKSVVEYCDKALEITYFDDMNNDILYTQALAANYLNDTKKAEADYKKIIQSDKKDMDAYMGLANVYLSTKDYDQAIEVYQEALEADKTAYEVSFALYFVYEEKGQTDAAKEVLDGLSGISSKKAENLLVIGRAYYYEGNSKKAQEYYSMSYDANCKESLYYLGILQKEAKEYDKAVKTFEKYIKEKKQDLTVDVYNRLASVYVEQGEYEKAQQALDKGFSYGSTDASQMLKKNQVLLYERQKKRTEAKKAAKEYMKLYPNDTGMQKELRFITLK